MESPEFRPDLLRVFGKLFARRVLYRPGERHSVALVARHEMEMQVKHRLSCRRAVRLIYRQALRLERAADRTRHLGGAAKYRGRLGLVQGEDVLRVLPDGHEHMARVHLADVHEGERMLVLVDYGCGDLLRHDPAENAVAHASPPGAW